MFKLTFDRYKVERNGKKKKRMENKKQEIFNLKERIFLSAERKAWKKRENLEKKIWQKTVRGSKHITRFSNELKGNSPESEGKKRFSYHWTRREGIGLVCFLSSLYQTCFKCYSQILNHVYHVKIFCLFSINL